MDLPPDYEVFKAEVLADQDDDDQGVYEVWWHANSRYPDLPLSARLALAERVVSELVAEGRVALAWSEGVEDNPGRKRVHDNELALRQWSTWVVQPDEPIVWMVDT